jgi:hypothetical protein
VGFLDPPYKADCAKPLARNASDLWEPHHNGSNVIFESARHDPAVGACYFGDRYLAFRWPSRTRTGESRVQFAEHKYKREKAS